MEGRPMRKLVVFAAMAFFIGVGSVTVAEAHQGSQSASCADTTKSPWEVKPKKHTDCEINPPGHRHICNENGWKKDPCPS